MISSRWSWTPAPPQRRAAGGVHRGLPDQRSARAVLARVRRLRHRRAQVHDGRVRRARPDVFRAAQGPPAPGDARGSRRRQARQGRDRAGGLPRRAAAHHRQRHVHHQRRGARDRFAAAPLAGRVLRRAHAPERQAAVHRAHHSVPRLVGGVQPRRQRHHARAHRPQAQAAGHGAAARARLRVRSRDPRAVLREGEARGEGQEGRGRARPRLRPGPRGRVHGRDPARGQRRDHRREGRDPQEVRARHARGVPHPAPGRRRRDAQHAAQGPDAVAGGGAPPHLQPAASGRAAACRFRARDPQQAVLQPQALRPGARRPLQAQPEAAARVPAAGPRRAQEAGAGHARPQPLDAVPRGLHRHRQVPAAAAHRRRAT